MIFPQAEFIMNFDNPTEALTGKRTSVQGFSVYEDYAIVLYHAGVCAVYDLITRDPAPLAAFKLATYDAGEEDKRYANHANDMMFGGFDEAGNPLMYITAGNSGEADEKGYIAYCAVEALEITTDEEGKKHFGSRLVQKIYYQNDGIENVPFQSPCWGWPASLVDVKNGRFYLHSARYRTTKDFVHLYNENNYIVTAFPLPPIGAGYEEVTLTPADILDQFEYPYDILATQGGTIHEDKLYYTFGFGKVGTPIGMRIADLKQKKLVSRVDFSFTPFGKVEIECCAPYRGKMLINTQHDKETAQGQIYAFDPAELLNDKI